MPIGKLSSKGQVTIPKQVRDALDLHPGDQIQYQVHGKVVTLTKGRLDALGREDIVAVAQQLTRLLPLDN